MRMLLQNETLMPYRDFLFLFCFCFFFTFHLDYTNSLANLIYLFRCKVDNEIIWIPCAIRKVPITRNLLGNISSDFIWILENQWNRKKKKKKKKRKQTIDTIMWEGFPSLHIFWGMWTVIYHTWGHILYIVYSILFDSIPFTWNVCLCITLFETSIYRVCSIHVEHLNL